MTSANKRPEKEKEPRCEMCVDHHVLKGTTCLSVGRRGPLPAIDATRTWETAEHLEQILGPGFELMHTKRMGWLLRQLGEREDIHGQLSMGYREVDSAPDGQLATLLLRHQERQRSQKENHDG